MDDKFKDIEALFSRMKGKFRSGEISQKEFVDGLKRLRIKDEEGRFWMIGAQSGQWYFFNGKDWVLSSPPSIRERKAICIYCGFENDLEAAVCEGCGGRVVEDGAEEKAFSCPVCGMEIAGDGDKCPGCSWTVRSAPESVNNGTSDKAAAEGKSVHHVIRSVDPLSFFWLSGGVGLFAGVLMGLIVGATAFFPGFVEMLPAFFKEMQGKLVGGVIFTGLGGILGFLTLSLTGFLAALMINAVLSFIGGLKIKLEETDGKRKINKP